MKDKEIKKEKPGAAKKKSVPAHRKPDIKNKPAGKGNEMFRLFFQNMDSSNSLYEAVTGENGKPCDYRFLDVNSEFEKITGKKASEVTGRTLLEVFPQTEPYWLEKFEEVLTTGIPVRFENYSRVLDRYTELSIYTIQDGLLAIISTDITERRHEELELQKAHERMLTIMNNTDALIYVADMETHELVFVNEYGRKKWGDDSTGRKCWEVLQGADGPCPFCTNDRLLNPDGTPAGVYQWVFRNNINKRWYNCRDYAIQWIDGRIMRMEVATDITEQKEMEEQLKNNEIRLQNIISGTNAGTWEWNIKTGETVFNERWAEIIGYTLDELEPVNIETWVKLAHPEDLKKSNELLQLHFNGELDFYSFESRMKHKDGSWVWVLDRGRVSDWDADGNPLKMSGTHIDITELKRAQEALRESDEKHRMLVENSHDIIYTMSPEGVFIFVSPSWTVLLGHPLDQVAGHPFQPFVHPDDIEGCMLFLQKVVETGQRQEGVEYRVRHINGTWRWHTTSAVPLKDEAGRITGFEGTARDITDQKLADDKIKSLLAEKEILLREVHHRIKNNMSTICGLILLQTYTIKDESAITALQDTERRISSMMMLYDKLYRSENFNEISVMDYIPSLVDEIVRNFPNSGKVKINKKVDDFTLDAKKLQSLGIIINELLTNIMKYAFTGRDEGRITVSVEFKDGKALIMIADNGIGIPEDIDFKTSKGFGMQLVSMLAAQLRGDIRIERGDGTKYVLEFEV